MDTAQTIWFDNGVGQPDRYFSVSETLDDNIDNTSKEMLYYAVNNGSDATINLSRKELKFVYHMLETPTPGHVCVLKTKTDMATGVRIVRLLTITRDKNAYRSTFNLTVLKALFMEPDESDGPDETPWCSRKATVIKRTNNNKPTKNKLDTEVRHNGYSSDDMV